MSDCFAASGALLSVDEMHARLDAFTLPAADIESCPLRRARDRILACELRAPLDLPRDTNAAMDGIAFASGAGRHLRVVGEALAGHPFIRAVGPGEAVRITTGAPLPPGCDTVEMLERLRFDAANVELLAFENVRPGQNVRCAGEEIRAGERVFAAGMRLGPSQLGMAASLGQFELPVYRRPRVALFSTGDELIGGEASASGDRPSPAHRLFDANSYSLAACLERWGAEVVRTATLGDRLEPVQKRLAEAASEADLIVTSGGVSAGRADLVRQAVEGLGRVSAWRIAIRPGKPLAFGTLRGRPFFGLPGNPVAALVTLARFVQPMIRRMGGETQWQPVCWQALGETAFRGRAGRLDLLRGCYRVDANGQLRVAALGEQGSHRLSSLYQANCLVELPDDKAEVEAGGLVTIQPLGELI